MTTKAEAVVDIVSVDALKESVVLGVAETMVVQPTISKKSPIGDGHKPRLARRSPERPVNPPRPEISIDRITRQKLSDVLGNARSVVAIRSDDPLVTQAVADVVGRVTEIVESRREALSQQNIDVLVDAYLKSEPTAQVRHELELDNARERARFIENYAWYTSKEVAQFAGHEASNASATANRWKKAGRIFGLPWKDGDLYPAFQFADGQPRPIIRSLLEIFSSRRTPWQIAFWLTSSNSWLDGAAPVDRLSDEGAVLAAAENEVGAVFG